LTSTLVSVNLPLVSTYREKQLDAIGDPTRRAILARLRKGPASVGKLATGFPVSRPAISQHLRVLKDAELVTDRAEGTRRVYELNPAAFASLREYFDEFWGVALISFKKRVENTSRRVDAGHGRAKD
jgi:DNA-binding transcriptional ArsR family regulator